MTDVFPDPDEARKLLGVSGDAGEKEVSRAYRREVRRLHPDTNPGRGAAQMFDRATRARDVLLEELRLSGTGSTPTRAAPPPEPEPTPPPEPEYPWESPPTSGGPGWTPRAEQRPPTDPWVRRTPSAGRPPPSGGYRHPFPGATSHPGYRTFTTKRPRTRRSAIAALVTAILMVMSCWFVFALPSVILAMMALGRSHDREKAVRYESYAWITIALNVVGGVVLGMVIVNGGE